MDTNLDFTPFPVHDAENEELFAMNSNTKEHNTHYFREFVLSAVTKKAKKVAAGFKDVVKVFLSPFPTADEEDDKLFELNKNVNTPSIEEIYGHR